MNNSLWLLHTCLSHCNVIAAVTELYGVHAVWCAAHEHLMMRVHFFTPSFTLFEMNYFIACSIYRQSSSCRSEKRSPTTFYIGPLALEHIQHKDIKPFSLWPTISSWIHTHVSTWSSYAYSFFFKPVKRNQNYLVITFAVVEVFQNILAAGTE